MEGNGPTGRKNFLTDYRKFCYKNDRHTFWNMLLLENNAKKRMGKLQVWKRKLFKTYLLNCWYFSVIKQPWWKKMVVVKSTVTLKMTVVTDRDITCATQDQLIHTATKLSFYMLAFEVSFHLRLMDLIHSVISYFSKFWNLTNCSIHIFFFFHNACCYLSS